MSFQQTTATTFYGVSIRGDDLSRRRLISGRLTDLVASPSVPLAQLLDRPARGRAIPERRLRK
ncbi:hypothetical protein OHB14_50430 [Streptomyces sp. NBC_01613]|uniref:hypothetical protein n=1 Tax=Streptomyces sp. NBC_01613 TaxID=2975896 RepID=UPI0038707F2C